MTAPKAQVQPALSHSACVCWTDGAILNPIWGLGDETLHESSLSEIKQQQQSSPPPTAKTHPCHRSSRNGHMVLARRKLRGEHLMVSEYEAVQGQYGFQDRILTGVKLTSCRPFYITKP